jgi:hypothetical protein
VTNPNSKFNIRTQKLYKLTNSIAQNAINYSKTGTTIQNNFAETNDFENTLLFLRFEKINGALHIERDSVNLDLNALLKFNNDSACTAPKQIEVLTYGITKHRKAVKRSMLFTICRKVGMVLSRKTFFFKSMALKKGNES